MASSTAPAKGKTKRAAKGKSKPQMSTKERDHGLERVYARLKPEYKAKLDAAAREDERSTMQYLERLIVKHLDQIDKKAGK